MLLAYEHVNETNGESRFARIYYERVVAAPRRGVSRLKPSNLDTGSVAMWHNIRNRFVKISVHSRWRVYREPLRDVSALGLRSAFQIRLICEIINQTEIINNGIICCTAFRLSRRKLTRATYAIVLYIICYRIKDIVG